MATKKAKAKKAKKYGDAKAYAAQEATGFEYSSFTPPDGASVFRFKKEGTYRIEVLEYEAGEGNPKVDEGTLWWERTFYTHRNIGTQPKSHYTCPAATAGKPCPVCEYVAKENRNPKADKKLLKELEPKKRQLFNIFDHEEEDKGVQVLEMSYHLFGKPLVAKINHADEDDNYENFFHSEDGLTLKLGVEQKTQGGSPYQEVVDVEFKTRKEELDAELFENVYNLDELVKVMTYKELKAIFEQTPIAGIHKKKGGKPKDDEDENEEEEDDGNEEEEEEEQEEAEATAEDAGIEKGSTVEHAEHGTCTVVHISDDGTSLKLKDEEDEIHKAIAVDEVTLVEEEEEEEEEEEVPKPRRKKKTVKKKPKDEEEEEEPEEEEEEEEPAPRKKKVVKKKVAPKKTGKKKKRSDDWE